ncbi:MAG: sulfurtransferase [Desulfuromusa sp.]|nr:sulfurtransferase [Desulfuromusa sp.]
MNGASNRIYIFISKLLQILLLLLLSVGLAHAATPLVDSGWLMANLDKPNIRILDLQPRSGYQRAHLPGSVNTDYGKWRVKGLNGTPAVIPEQDYLDNLIGQLGIDKNTHVILAPVGAGASDMAVATRIYWTFKAMGHDEISILNGGLTAYSQIPGHHFVDEAHIPEPKQFKGQLRPEYFPGAKAVKAALDRGVTFVDSRSYDEYIGKVGGGWGKRAGTIPGSILLSFDRLVVNGSGQFHDLDKIKEIYQSSGVPITGEQISFCHTGHRTSLFWFVSHELLGNKDARMYDGSTIEWEADHDLPLDILYKRK